MHHRTIVSLVIIAGACVLACGCKQGQPGGPGRATPPDNPERQRPPPRQQDEPQGEQTSAASASDPPTATARLQARSGSSLSGSARFEQLEGGVRVTVTITHAPPGKHGVHVHETGDCSGSGAAAAGGHFAPRGPPHGLPPQQERHLGDLGNITIGEDGTGTLTITVDGATLDLGASTSFADRALIVHAREDDGSQPTGAAGDRIGCGVIRAG